MLNIRSVSLGLLISLGLTACADMSMYNQVPAPIEGARQWPAEVNTYPIEAPGYEEIEQQQVVKQPVKENRVRNPAVIALLDDAHTNRQQGELSVAASKLERAVRIAPQDAKVWHELASIRFQQNRFQSAEGLAKKSIVYSKNDRSLLHKNWLLIADSREQLGQTTSARKARVEANKYR